ncbi:P-loop containing nucleoside triphosphate hydrolase protein [Hymenopellis radicata]|nr:P-loop containing nucleoside triphosphate hydrolase protein [Hymenopellis radicata]
MPPKRGIVKSGNAGNSKSVPTKAPVTDVPENKPLFPAGSKYPLSLLHERCQKNGWEKPIVNTRRKNADWTFKITLRRVNKKGEHEEVDFVPHPEYVTSSEIEAKHWGATYALYRVCNNIQLNRVLPEGPREYWNKLAAEHKAAPDHLKWMYDTDPFAAKKMVAERQVKAAERREVIAAASTSSTRASSPVSREFERFPEVKMAPELRAMVEDCIKQAMEIDPLTTNQNQAIDIPPEELQNVMKQLNTLGFSAVQARKAADFFSKPSGIAGALLASQGLLEACTEYLLLHLPECDLPQRFLPSKTSSDAFITAVHVGTDDLKTRWLVEKATKEAGWPVHVVRECLVDARINGEWDLLLSALGKRLLGQDPGLIFDLEGQQSSSFDMVAEDIEALGAYFETPTHIIMPLFGAPIQWHILVANGSYPRPGYAPMYLTSSSVPAYIRLHMLSCLLVALQSEDFDESGGGFILAGMGVLDEEWAKIEDHGPPSISAVFQHFMRTDDVSSREDDVVVKGRPRDAQRSHAASRDHRSDAQVKAAYYARREEEKKKFEEMMAVRQRLPAFTSKDEFLDMLEGNRVVVVVGETGCGKTTQLPQFILDSLIQNNRGAKANIVITQPRRISAIGVSSRVSAERLEDGSVGYAIRGESSRTKETKLLFCTTGVVLRRLSSGTNWEMSPISYQVHERSVDGDFLLLELKELLRENKTLKVVLMSATINHETFISYFGGAPLLSIPGFTHPVTDVYLEDVISSINYRPAATRTKQTKESAEAQQAFRNDYRSMGLSEENITALQNITRADGIDYKLLAALVHHIVTTAKSKGGILIFLPGVQEIRQCMETIRDILPNSVRADILPLHANLSSDEQRQVFKKTPNWKIIASTNVAETSITIDDVIFVIDSGKVKQTQYDGDAGLSRLAETWVTRAEARQRRGRAGRTQPGTCYKLYTRRQESSMGSFAVPEILRVPLDSLSLSVKVTRQNEDVRHFLKKAIDPPNVAAMDTAWSTLQNLGAIDEQDRLTALGRHISLLPIDLRLAKMLVLGTIFRCLGPVLTIAACLSSKPLFVSPMDKRQEASRARAQFSEGTSDLLTDLKAFDTCTRLRAEGKPASFVRQYCEENFISPATVREVGGLRQDFLSALANIGFVPQDSKPSTSALNTNSDNENLLKAIILGGLWPRVARVHLPKNAIKFDKVSGGTVQRENIAKEYKMFDLRDERVFLHPASVLFDFAAWKSQYVVYFTKMKTTKLYLRDATEVPLYAILLFGGPVAVDQVKNGLTIDGKEGVVKLRAWARIGTLVNLLRRLLDAQLQRSIEESSVLSSGQNNHVIRAMLALLSHDGVAAP